MFVSFKSHNLEMSMSSSEHFCACYVHAICKHSKKNLPQKLHILVPLGRFPWFNHHSVALVLLYNMKLEWSFPVERFWSYTPEKNWHISTHDSWVVSCISSVCLNRLVSYIQNYSCLSVHPSIRYGDARDHISGHWALEARTRQSLWTAVMALATGTNTNFLDRLYKKGNNVHLHVVACS